MRILKRLAFTFFALICLYLILLVAVYAIPNHLVSDNVHSAVNVILDAGEYPQYFFGYPFAQADNNTDKEMFLNLLNDNGDSVIKAAMVPRYARYWQGYAVFLRPLSVFLNVTNIRYLNMVVIALLLCLCFWKIAEQISAASATAFLLGLIASFIWLAPFNIQYFIVSALTMIFSLFILYGYRRKNFMPNIAVIFLCFGSMTNFFDFLTFPILTLGYPLILLLLLRRQKLGDITFVTECKVLLICSVCWFAGYGLTLLAKGLFGTLFTGTNVLGDIVDNAIRRIDGEIPSGYHAKVSAWLSVETNLIAFFNARNLGLFVIAIVSYAFMALKKKRGGAAWATALPILLIAAFPYVWYGVLQNHSIMHMYYTYKAQAVTFFAVCAYFIAVRDFAKQRQKALETQPTASGL